MSDRDLVEEEIKDLDISLKGEIKKIKNALSQLETDLAILQTGDANGPYWNGPGAYSFYKSCLGHIDHDYVLLKNLDKCSQHIETLTKV